MARGHSDWNFDPSNIGQYSIDNAELAARLGSPVSFYRSGRVVLYDTCSSGKGGWYESLSGNGAAVTAVTDKFFRQDGSVELTSGDTLLSQTQVIRLLPLVFSGRVGIEIAWSLSAFGYDWRIVLLVFDGTNSHSFHIWHELDNDNLKLLKADGSFVTLDTISDFKSNTDHWWISKLVVDTNSKEYIRYHFNDITYDISAYKPNESADSSLRRIEVRLTNTSVTTRNSVININDFIFTIEEP